MKKKAVKVDAIPLTFSSKTIKGMTLFVGSVVQFKYGKMKDMFAVQVGIDQNFDRW